ncbi:hypothetical protein KKD03_00905 [Patescibacteria group bacterium]|nr:hypothetical protein [Patescibacteria group bacterium]
MLQNTLKYLKDPIDLVQIENDGIPLKTWDVNIFLQEAEGNIEKEMNIIARDIDSKIAYEFFSNSTNCNIILGIKFISAYTNIVNSQCFIKKMYELTSQLLNKNQFFIEAVINYLNKNMFQEEMFKENPSHITLGVVNHWKDNCLEIQKVGEKVILNDDKLNKILQKCPSIVSSKKNYLGLEFEYFATKKTPQYWLTIQVSDLIDDKHILNKEKLLSLINVWTNYQFPTSPNHPTHPHHPTPTA